MNDTTPSAPMAEPVRVAYLVTHPIQYQAPMLRAVAADPDIALKVFFCSTLSVQAYRDEDFGREIKWDVPLLEGYDHAFLPALSKKNRLGLLRPLNYGLTRELEDGRFDVLWVHGHLRPYHLYSVMAAKRNGLKVLNRDEGWAGGARRGAVKQVLNERRFRWLGRNIDGFLSIGSANRDYYIANGIDEARIFPMPYAIDNGLFDGAAITGESRALLRAGLGLEEGRPVILFAAKFIARKRPGDLLDAYARLIGAANGSRRRKPYLVMVGDGRERERLMGRATALGLDSVRFPGFVNQSELPAYYDLCDAFVLPSEQEPWGLAVNEAMAMGRAVIIGDQVGAAADLVREGENGHVFLTGDIAALADAVTRTLADPAACRAMGERSREIIAGWSFAEDVAGLKLALHYLANSPNRESDASP